MFQAAVAKASKKKRFPKLFLALAIISEIPIIFNPDIDVLPTLKTESTIPEKMVPGFQQTIIA
jgi:hypothetical protein